MPQATVAADIAEALDVELGVRAQRSLDHVLVFYDLAHAPRFIFGPVLGLLERVDIRFLQDLSRSRPPDPEYGGESKFTPLIRRYVYSSNSWHVSLRFSAPDRNRSVHGYYPCRCLFLGFFLLMM